MKTQVPYKRGDDPELEGLIQQGRKEGAALMKLRALAAQSKERQKQRESKLEK